MKSKSEMVIAWLNDAHAMENSLAAVLRHRIKDAKGFPEIEYIDRQHLNETLRHVDLVRQCIARYGKKPSRVKAVMGTVTGMIQAPGTELARDEVLKNCLIDYAAENFEVASYRALIAAATEIGDTETATTCEQIMREDQAMADRIEAVLADAVRVHIGTQSTFPAGRAASGELIGQYLSDGHPEIKQDASVS